MFVFFIKFKGRLYDDLQTNNQAEEMSSGNLEDEKSHSGADCLLSHFSFN